MVKLILLLMLVSPWAYAVTDVESSDDKSPVEIVAKRVTPEPSTIGVDRLDEGPVDPEKEKSWVEVVGETIQSFSEIIAVLIGAGLTILLGRGERKRQREEAVRERQLDSAASLIESMDAIRAVLSEAKLKCTNIINASGESNASMRMVQIEVSLRDFAQNAVDLKEFTKSFRTSCLRYQLLSQKESELITALGFTREFIKQLETLLRAEPETIGQSAEQLLQKLSGLETQLSLVEKSVREKIDAQI
ncbi:MAG: hypothetical protein JAY75_21910 [Candidatus Thiodiazotropha taylori]|nr:hypothetical protein [Candidatus Thiodiazotropha taylori]MCG8094477.1 hypothetical protein [Candidatus Thiodiazotropha endolucinida]MCG7885278.1 hypothetical protein [Candidatus Thiodiazotropha taylori]MCG7891915.1 hypothetical protein [Candidatus Thiodiazotropha taylori]MCG7949625.1 hypothetical protein [Candidatus Thiodiazotropha taylori]